MFFNYSFEWDHRKDNANRLKHGVSFNEARTVFQDKQAIEIYDDSYEEEDRYLLLGASRKGRVLVVCFCLRGWPERFRIISARKASKREEMEYFNHE